MVYIFLSLLVPRSLCEGLLGLYYLQEGDFNGVDRVGAGQMLEKGYPFNDKP